jgi:hypothetical protein
MGTARLGDGAREKRVPSLAHVAIGLVAGVITWKLIDAVMVRDTEQLNLGNVRLTPSLWLILIGAAVTWLLIKLPLAGAGFAGVLLVGVFVANLRPEWLPSGETAFVVLRGSHESAILMLIGAGVTAAVSAFVRGGRARTENTAVRESGSRD